VSEWRVETRETVNDRRLLSLSEVAEVMGVARALAKELVESGQIASLRSGKDYRVPLAAIDAYYRNLAAQAVPAIPAVRQRKRAA
jgi:excisionase family DNA binding protein